MTLSIYRSGSTHNNLISKRFLKEHLPNVKEQSAAGKVSLSIVFKTPAARFSINLSITYVLKWQRYIEATAHLVHVYE